jgi:neprilysin
LFNYVELVEERGLEPMKKILEKMGGWPAVEGQDWNGSNWSWQKTAINCRNYGYNHDQVVDFSVGTDLKNSSTKIVDVCLT